MVDKESNPRFYVLSGDETWAVGRSKVPTREVSLWSKNDTFGLFERMLKYEDILTKNQLELNQQPDSLSRRFTKEDNAIQLRVLRVAMEQLEPELEDEVVAGEVGALLRDLPLEPGEQDNPGNPDSPDNQTG